MKKYIMFVLLLLLTLPFCLAKDFLSWQRTHEGGILVDNSKGNVEDRIRLINNSSYDIEISIMGNHKKKGVIQIAVVDMRARDTDYIDTPYEDDLDDFKSFIISTENGNIISCLAECSHDDLIFSIDKFSPSYKNSLKTQRGTESIQESNTITNDSVDELLKWKELLDAGIITQVEFDIKKKQLLGM